MDLGLLDELLVGPCHSAHLTLGHQFVTLIGPPESASLPPLALRDATKLNPTSLEQATSWRSPVAIGTTVVLPQVCNLTALTRPVKGAWRGYDVASTHRT